MDKAHPFGPEFVAAQREKYGHRQPQGRMLSYDQAVEDNYEPWRTWLDEQLVHPPAGETEAFAANLWRDQNFWSYNIELAPVPRCASADSPSNTSAAGAR